MTSFQSISLLWDFIYIYVNSINYSLMKCSWVFVFAKTLLSPWMAKGLIKS